MSECSDLSKEDTTIRCLRVSGCVEDDLADLADSLRPGAALVFFTCSCLPWKDFY